MAPTAPAWTAPLPLPPDAPGAAPVSVYSNTLWLDDAAVQEPWSAATGSPLRRPLKSLAAAVAEASSGAAWRESPAHLIAPCTRTPAVEECEAWRSSKLLHGHSLLGAMGDDDSSGSPRIGVSRRGSSSSFSALFRQLSQVVSAKRRGTAAAAPPAAAALEPPPPAHSYRELAALEQCGGASAAQGSPTLPELPHASPAHLLAPAPATLWGASQPAAVVQLVAAGGDADGEGGSGAGAEQQLDDLLMDLLDELPAAPAAPTAQLAAAVAAEAAEALPAAQQLEADDEEQELQALLAQQVSDLSSPTSGHYSPAAAQGRNLRGPTPSASGTTGSWQAQREEGVQRSLAHPIFALQPGELPPQAAASLDALVAAQRRPRHEGSPQCCISSAVRCHEGAATPGPAWRLEDGHFALDLELDELAPAPGGDSPACPASPLSMLSLALEGVPDAPAAAAAWAGTPASQLQQEQQQHEHVAVSCMAGHYDAIAQRFARLDLRRLRRAVRRSLKRQQAEEAALRPAPRLLQRLTLGCFSGAGSQAAGGRLSRAMEAQRLRLLCLGRLPYSPDEPLHFELWQLVCLGFTGQGAIEDHPAEALSSVPAWRALGCSAANPAHSLGDCGVLPLLHLLLALDYTSQLAARLLGAALGSPWAAPRAAPRPPPFSLVEVAAAATRWTLRLAAGGGLSSEARRLGSLTIAAELFWLGAVACFLDGWEAAAAGDEPQRRAVDPQRLLLAQLVQAEQLTCGNVRATVMRHCRPAA